MSKQDSYVLGINAYDHDVSACLLRDGEIAFAICKERITRQKHDTGFYQEVVDYCLAAEGISLDDVGLVVRGGGRDGGGRGRQLQLGYRRAGSADRKRQSVGARIRELLQVHGLPA